MFFASEVNNTPIPTGVAGSGVNWGTSVTPGASGAWGAWTVLIAGAANTRGGRWHRTAIINYGGSDKNLLLDYGCRPAGAAGSEATLVPRLVGGKAADNQVYNAPGYEYSGPIDVPVGYDIVCRAMSNQVSPGTVYVATSLEADPVYEVPYACQAEAIGVSDVNVRGTDVVAFSNASHNVAGYGSNSDWVLLGVTTRESKWMDAHVLKHGTDAGSQYMAMQVAAGDATNKAILLSDGIYGAASNIQYFKRRFRRTFNRVPPGTNIYARVVSQATVTVSCAVWNYY